jgi:nucleotide-binding universal stress UspA family protein
MAISVTPSLRAAYRRARPAHRPAELRSTGTFRSVIVPVSTALPELPWDMLEVAAQLAAPSRSRIVVVAFTEIPLWEEFDVELPEAEATAVRWSDEIRSLTARYGVSVHLVAPRTRHPAETILAEARRRKADLVLLGATSDHRLANGNLLSDRVTRQVAEEAEMRTLVLQPAAA